MCGNCGCDSIADVHGHQHSMGRESELVHHHEEIDLTSDILAANNHFALKNREYFKRKAIVALNLLSSPGSGKTTLLENTVKALRDEYTTFVIEGDQHTELDALRIREAGAKAFQINTGKVCHLDAHMVGHALEHLEPDDASIVFIENVGNLICPALFDLGELVKVVILAVTEGADKPLKYPDMFVGADLVIINKTDLIPYVKFDVAQCIGYIRRLNAKAEIIELAATQIETMGTWIEWIKRLRR